MAGYLGTKAVLLSTTAADVIGNAEIGGDLTVGGNITSTGIDDNASSTAITIDSSENLLVGTTSNPSNRKLRVYGPVEFDGAGVSLITHQSSGTEIGSAGQGNYVVSGGPADGYGITSSTSLVFGSGGYTERMRIDSSGCLLVNTTSKLIGSETAKFSSTGSGTNTLVLTHDSTDDRGILVTLHGGSSGSTSRTHAAFLNSGGFEVGSVKANGSSTSYNTSSDYRLKTDAQPMTGASARVQALNPVNFEWIADGTRVDGFLAHEAQEVVPEAVTGTKDAMRDEEYEVTPAVYEGVVIPAVLDEEGNELEAERTEQRLVTEAVMGTRSVPAYQGIDQSKLVPLLTAALQEALTKIDDMETRLAALEGK